MLPQLCTKCFIFNCMKVDTVNTIIKYLQCSLLNKECLINWWSMPFGSHFTKPEMQALSTCSKNDSQLCFMLRTFPASTISLSLDLCFFHVYSVDWLKLSCLHSSTAFTPHSNLPSISIFSLMVQSVCWCLDFETEILKCNACGKKENTEFYIILNAFISHVEAVNTKHNRYIKECIYFSKHMLTLSIQTKTKSLQERTLTVASFFNLK